MYILGLNCYHPDSSACIVKDGMLLAAAEEERFLRIKHWAGFPGESIAYCLKEAGIGLEDIDYIALNRNPKANLHKKLIFILSGKASLQLVTNRLLNVFKIKEIKDMLSEKFSVPKNKIEAKIFHIEHHRAHLASAFFVSPFENAAVISIDGFGDFTSCMVARGASNKLDILYEINFPYSLGIFYTAFTQFLGFKSFGDEYKVMGLAAYGKPSFTDKIRKILVLGPKGSFRLNPEYFSFYKSRNSMFWNNVEPKLEDVFSDKLIRDFGPVRNYNEEILAFHCDIASSAQQIYEEVFFHILNYAYEITSSHNLCLAGGCALNSLANGKIFDHTPFKEIYIQPASSDGGGSLGAAYYLYNCILKQKRKFIMKDAYWGPAFNRGQIEAILNKNREQLKGYAIEIIENNSELCRKTAEFIAQGKIVGWFQGRMEWGPRALGNRSILADPRKNEMKDILNARIKKREWFRPFAPAVLLEDLGEYFEKNYPDPFMLKVYRVRQDKINIIPAVTHIDGTGRVQSVSREENPLFWQLINEFKKITGVPMFLNTSFNENEPIVCTPQEALDCFLRTKMDVLVLGNYLIKKPV